MNDHSQTGETYQLGSMAPQFDPSSLRIGVMGCYGFGNAGDEIILENIRHLFCPREVVPFQTAFPATEADIERLNVYDFLILGGGGLYGQTPASPFDTFGEWEHLLQRPIGVLGLGVRQLDECYLPATHRFIDRSEFFVVRDVESKQLIGHPKVEVAPDITFYRPFPVHDYPPNNPRIRAGINLRPVGVKMATWVEAVRALPCDKTAVPFSVVPMFDDRELLRLVASTCPDRFQPGVYQTLDVFIGTAFHSIVFAIQSGIPTIAISYLPKVQRLMEGAGLGDYVLKPDQTGDLLACFERLLTDRDRVRRQMLVYREQSQADWQERAKTIKRIVDNAVSSREKTTSLKAQGPRVSILVHAPDNTSNEDFLRTVESCSSQTYTNTEILVLGVSEDKSDLPTCLHEIKRVFYDSTSLRQDDWVSAGLSHATGDLVAWMETGSWYTADAIETMVRIARKSTAAAGVFSDHYLTDGGLIQRKVDASIGTWEEQLSNKSLCMVVGKEEAGLIRRLQLDSGTDLRAVQLAPRFAHTSHGLLLTPATQSELDLYRAAVAYGRKQNATGLQLLRSAITLDPGLGCIPRKQEQAFRGFLEAAFNPLITENPVDYLVRVCSELPSESITARRFKKVFVGRALVEAAYISHARGQTPTARRLLLRAFCADVDRLRNRGTLAFFLQTMVGEHVMTYYRRAKAALYLLRPPNQDDKSLPKRSATP